MEKAKEVGAATYSTAIREEGEGVGIAERTDEEVWRESAREERLARESKVEK